MKKPKVFRLRLLLGLVPGKSRRRGVAILTVLAVVSLMTVLIISFFNMAQTAKTTAVGTVEMQRVVTLKDTITGYVMAQIRDATTLAGGTNNQTIWTSQPGAIRTYSATTSYSRLYKLYSSPEMMIDTIDKDESAKLLNKIEDDVDPRWDEYLDMYVDLNRPVRPSSGDDSSENPTEIKTRLIYPIADPSRYNGQESATTENTPGFVYGERSLSSRQINGVDSREGRLAMPVRWIYLLEDGTPGTVDKEGKFLSMASNGGEPSRTNPIVSRIAWWTDDETCKINVNTASTPVPWDTPRTSSGEDVWYAQRQPISGECQHYPGHPAQTDLAAVFFPGYRYVPSGAPFTPGVDMSPLPETYATLLWNICPFITEKGGSEGGSKRVDVLTVNPMALDVDDHLYATFDELYFKARNQAKNLNTARGTVERDDPGGKFLERLEASQFFLTTRSAGPETTVGGLPRVCLFPMNEHVITEVGKTGGNIPVSVGGFEVTLATNSTLGAANNRPGKAYYLQRSTNADSRHNNFYNSTSRGARDARNVELFKYLKKQTVSIPPGYPELTGSEFNTFGKKYPGPNGIDGNQQSTEGSKQNVSFDSSDRTQILLQMLDMLRSSNMAPGYLESGQSYDNGNGQVAGICGCMAAKPGDIQANHTSALLIPTAGNTPVTYTPKGSGRTYGAAEICFLATVPRIKKGGKMEGANITPRNPAMATKWNQATNASLVQVGVLINAFSPRQGWAPLFAESGVNISNKFPAGGSDPRTNGANANQSMAPFTMANNTLQLPFNILAGADGRSPAPQAGQDPPLILPPGFVPWGGVSGARVSSTLTVATLDAYCYEGTGAGGTATINVQLGWTAGEILRIFLYDGAPDAANTIQAIELEAPPSAANINLTADYSGKQLTEVLRETLTHASNAFPPQKLPLSSFVVPHGDYRLTTIPLKVERGVYVPHGKGGHAVMEPTVTGRTVTMLEGRGASLAFGNEGLLFGPGMTPMRKEFSPHFAPVNPDHLCQASLGSLPMPGVMAVASSSSDRTRRLRFANGRRDGQYTGPLYRPFREPNKIPNRGSSDPIETGDFDTGVGLCPDGAYMNQPDDGDARDSVYPYYQQLDRIAKVSPASFSPNRVFRSAVDFGSIPTGVQARVPWQTLRFRPDPQMFGPNQIRQLGDAPKMPDGYDHYFPFSNYCGPKDHLLLDMFWMPVVEPWSISEGFATKGLINLNQQILPFTYIQRTTALHALFQGERMMAIPDSEANNYKNGDELNSSKIYRHWINARETIKQITDFRWKGQDPEGFTLPFNTFRSASEICELWLVPMKNGSGTESGTWDLNYIIRDFWKDHRLTGDNTRERPYSNLYPRLTVRSNVYKVHMIAQTLKQASGNDPETFSTAHKENSDPDLVTAEWRGSALVERVLNPNEPELQQASFDYAPDEAVKIFDGMTVTWPAKLDNFYTYRVTEVKQFTE